MFTSNLTDAQSSSAEVHEKKGIALSYFIISLSPVTLCTFIFTYPLFSFLFLFCLSPVFTFPVAMFKRSVCTVSSLRFLFLSEGDTVWRQAWTVLYSPDPPQMDRGSDLMGWWNSHKQSIYKTEKIFYFIFWKENMALNMVSFETKKQKNMVCATVCWMHETIQIQYI